MGTYKLGQDGGVQNGFNIQKRNFYIQNTTLCLSLTKTFWSFP